MGNTIELGLIGSKLGHSYSKAFFESLFAQKGIQGSYELFEMNDIDQLPGLLEANPGLNGFNVTVPYKESIIEYLDSVSEKAAAIGAVNTVKVFHDGKGGCSLKGFNTDAAGVIASLKDFDKPPGLNAYVLGSGGASKAVVFALESLCWEPTVVSRTPSEGRISYSEFSKLLENHGPSPILLVNATPLGMWPDTGSFPEIPYEALKPNDLCFDIVYNPGMTTFMKKCAQRGCWVKNGLEMLHAQALKSWAIWT